MIILPKKEFKSFTYMNKIYSYNLLHSFGFPVFKSVLLKAYEDINKQTIMDTFAYLQSSACTVRYQYIKPCSNPAKGGNKVPISIASIREAYVLDTWLWLLEPIDRLTNLYGINIRIDKRQSEGCIECVGKGFDVSDINRGNIQPQQLIRFALPFNYGWHYEFWKYLKFEFITQEVFEESKIIRLEKLKKLGFLSVSNDIFSTTYNPLPMEIIERLLNYLSVLYEEVDEESFVTSCSIGKDGKLIFWDIQTEKEKKYILQERSVN